MSEELIIWMSPRVGFIDIADRFCTGSSIMPQKKNPDVRIVINAISLETVSEVMGLVDEGVLPDAEILQVSAARSKVLGRYHMMMGQNPVYIISAGGRKPGQV